MCDEGERITKGVGGIRVSCYGPVTFARAWEDASTGTTRE